MKTGFIIMILICIAFILENEKIITLQKNIKSLSVKQELDIAESRQHEQILASLVNPKFIKTLKEFTEEVKTENAYLKSFTEVRK